ncbi:S8 family serine peptidase [Vicingus serpentipes]|uniref:S8 family serine peptidase n=1 Tax=Vicingus serpentipes TaxID=1926625 RepID=A0A5C6RXH2_9FLAO|nr:S8 family serine peptidase [Vicingus serpentipes]TXB66807.1 S8 family serine peptidase [Vicingus serpentipes]
MNSLKHISVLLFFLVSSFVGSSQVVDDFLPKTIILKVKEAYRNNCTENEIKHINFQKISNEINVVELKKIFPNHRQELNKKLVDLSLIYQLNYDSNISEKEVISKLKKASIFQYVELYIVPQLAYTPSDTNAADPLKNWHLTMTNAFNAWDINKGDTNVVIGITDTGWDETHPDLLGNCKKNYADPINGIDDDNDGYVDNYMGWDMGEEDNSAQYNTSAHGVHVTGLAAAVTDNVTGIASIGFNSKFLPIKISDATGALTKAYQGVVYAADHGCFTINCSWGSYTAGLFQKDVIDYATINKGCLVIGACGNDDGETMFYPAGYESVLTVAASEQSDFKKNNSNYGYYVDISAPGEAMWSTYYTGSYGYNGGTSMAAPVVAGAAAVVKAQFPSYSNQQVAAQLRATADDMNPLNLTYFDKLGNGRLDLFDALSTSAQFVELISKTFTDNNNQIFEAGDTVRISGTYLNYLSAITGLNVTLSSLSSFVNVIDGTTALPSLSSLEQVDNATDPFLVEVLSGAGSNEEILFKATISNGSYTINEYFTMLINPNFINITENQVSSTITSIGRIGYLDAGNTIGLGFSYNGEQLLYEAGLMVGDGTTRVADVVRGLSGQDNDFSSAQNVMFNPPYVSAIDLIGQFDDSPLLPTPIDLSVEHNAYAYSSAPDDKYIIVTYNLKNNGITPLTNLHVGLFADWDIQDAYKNKSGYDALRKMGYVHSLEPDTIYAAIKLLSASTAYNYSIDYVSGGAGGVDMNGGFTTAEKFTTIATNRLNAGAPNGQDVMHVVSSGNFTLNPGEGQIISFAIIAGDSLSDIQASADAAQTKYIDVIGIEELTDKNESLVFPNPTTGKIAIKSDEMIEYITLKNVLGETLKKFNTVQLDISNYPNGVYFIEVKTKNGVFSTKLLKVGE